MKKIIYLMAAVIVALAFNACSSVGRCFGENAHFIKFDFFKRANFARIVPSVFFALEAERPACQFTVFGSGDNFLVGDNGFCKKTDIIFTEFQAAVCVADSAFMVKHKLHGVAVLESFCESTLTDNFFKRQTADTVQNS